MVDKGYVKVFVIVVDFNFGIYGSFVFINWKEIMKVLISRYLFLGIFI